MHKDSWSEVKPLEKTRVELNRDKTAEYVEAIDR